MKFSRPPIYPFWLWNGEEQESEITRQLSLIAERGLPGIAIHARTGNQVPYLSPRWMALFRHACVEAKKRNLAVWIYDELGFPSGTANGALPATGEDFQQKSLHFEVHPKSELSSLKKQKDILRIFPKKNNQLLVFRRHVLPQFSDFLNPKTAPLFLKLVHEKYHRALKEFFGNVIQAVFTDDNLFLLERGAALPYTDSLENAFRKEYGYSILDHLDALVENHPKSPVIRLDYYRLLANMLNEGFIRPMQDWCTKHNLKFYGHLSSDEGPLDYCVRSFGDPGSYMMTLNVPGCDDFLTMYHDWSYLRNPRNHCNSIDALNGISGFSAIQVMKQASSVASQLGDGTCMSETFSSLGWGISPASLIAHMNFLCLMGINISVPHYYTYSTGAQAKRDHPASFFFQQPYFHHSKEIFAETDRTLQLTAHGSNFADVLVIHPIDSVQATLDGSMLDVPGNFQCDTPSPYPGSLEMSTLFQELSLVLAQSHVGFEYGYESVLRLHGSATRNGLKAGKQTYSTIILPNLVNISSHLCQLLRSSKNIKIIYFKQKPTLIDGKNTDQKSLPDGILCRSYAELKKHLPAPLLSGLQSKETGVSCRLVNGKREYMVAHYGQNPVVQHFDLPGYALFNPAKDTYFTTPLDYTLFPGRAIHLLPIKKAAQFSALSHVFTTYNKSICKANSTLKWTVSMNSQYNNLLIDAARPPYSFLVRFDDPAYAQEPKGSISSLKLSISPKISSPLFLYFEPQNISLLKFNGVDLLQRRHLPCPQTASLSAVEITDLVKQDTQDLLTFAFTGSRPEFLYLAGKFAVTFKSPALPDGAGSEMAPIPIAAAITRQPTFGDLSKQGFPFYWGSVFYSTALTLKTPPKEDLVLEIPEAIAAAIRLKINNHAIGTLTQAPWRWTLPAKYLTKKVNQIELELMNTAQNFFGPHHPDTQRAHFSAWRPSNEEYFSVAPFGILSQPKIKSNY